MIRTRTTRIAVAVLAAVVGSAATAEAQIHNTGMGGALDDNWRITWGWNIAPSAADLLFYTNPTGGPTAASIVTAPPTPPWTPNGPLSNWISMNSSANQEITGPVIEGDNVARFFYNFETDLVGTGAITGNIGWDNRLIGYQFLDAGGSDLGGFVGLGAWVSPTPDADEGGFCRDADGVFPTGNYPNCLADLSIEFVQGAAGIRFVVHGDGVTDAFRVDNAFAVPEPSTYVLMASGLLALGLVSRRRKA